jgi:hypothetical protein
VSGGGDAGRVGWGMREVALGYLGRPMTIDVWIEFCVPLQGGFQHDVSSSTVRSLRAGRTERVMVCVLAWVVTSVLTYCPPQLVNAATLT